MNENDAFRAEPPVITIRGEEVRLRKLPADAGLLKVGVGLVDTDDNTAIALTYMVLCSLPPAEARTLAGDKEKLTEELDLARYEVAADDALAVGEYISGVFERAEAAEVDLPETPGKQPAD